MENASLVVLIDGTQILTYDNLKDCFEGKKILKIRGVELIQELIVSKDIQTDRIIKQIYGAEMSRMDYDQCANDLMIHRKCIAYISMKNGRSLSRI